MESDPCTIAALLMLAGLSCTVFRLWLSQGT